MSGTVFIVSPVLPKKYKNEARFGRRPASKLFYAHSPEGALQDAVLDGFIPSNTVMQYYKAVPKK